MYTKVFSSSLHTRDTVIPTNIIRRPYF